MPNPRKANPKVRHSRHPDGFGAGWLAFTTRESGLFLVWEEFGRIAARAFRRCRWSVRLGGRSVIPMLPTGGRRPCVFAKGRGVLRWQFRRRLPFARVHAQGGCGKDEDGDPFHIQSGGG